MIKLQQYNPEISIVPRDDDLAKRLRAIFSTYPQLNIRPDFSNNPFLVNGTEFQRRTWQSISEVGPSETLTYGEVAKKTGQPSASRAVGNACGCNPLALIIPCHRIVGSNWAGGFNGGKEIKQFLLQLETRQKGQFQT